MRVIPSSPTLARLGRLPRATHNTKRATTASTSRPTSLSSASACLSRTRFGSRPALMSFTSLLAANASSRTHEAITPSARFDRLPPDA